jgi:hypothetical protein
MLGISDALIITTVDTRLCMGNKICGACNAIFVSKSGSNVLWIDMICFDQTKIRRRNFRASLIGRIYDVAERTLNGE